MMKGAAVVLLVSSVTSVLGSVLAAADARADELEIPELAPTTAPGRWAIALDDARVVGDDELGAASEALIVSAHGHEGGWVGAVEVCALTYRDSRTQLDGSTMSSSGSMAGLDAGVARWFGRGALRFVVRTQLAIPLDSDEPHDLPPSMQLRVTAAPWSRSGPASLKLAAGARYDAAGFALQAEAGADVGYSSGEHASWAHGLVWAGGGLAFPARPALSFTLHALARWLPADSPWKRDDEGVVVGVGGRFAVRRGHVGVRAEVRVDGCQLATDGGLTTRDAFCSRLLVAYSQPFGR